MASNVLPSAPNDESSMYPQLPAHDFRMQKANEVSVALNAEVVHYRSVAKKYKRAKKVANWSATGSTIISTAVSSASLASALSVVGLPAAIPLGGVGGAFALASSSSVYRLYSGAPNDNFRKNICSEDHLRSRIFGTFVAKFLACMPLLGFSNI